MSAEDAIYIDENHRLRVEYDESPSNPRTEWDQVTGFVTIEPRSGYYNVPEVHEDPTGRIAVAHEHFDNAGYPAWDPNKGWQRRRNYYPDAEEITVRWAKIFYDLTLEYDSEYQGYWFVDPDEFKKNWNVDEDGMVEVWEQNKNPDGTYASGLHVVGKITKAAKELEIIAGEEKSYRQWAKGEVYGVIAEKRVAKHVVYKDLETGEEISQHDAEEWQVEESLWGIFMDDDYYGPTFEKMALTVAKESFGDEFTKK
jgi:hypothetical protein